MTTKHDAKRARENIWVTKQALARGRGAGGGFKHPTKSKPATKTAPTKAAAPAPEPKTEIVTDETSAAPESDAS